MTMRYVDVAPEVFEEILADRRPHVFLREVVDVSDTIHAREVSPEGSPTGRYAIGVVLAVDRLGGEASESVKASACVAGVPSWTIKRVGSSTRMAAVRLCVCGHVSRLHVDEKARCTLCPCVALVVRTV